jgi:hypothetical protein
MKGQAEQPILYGSVRVAVGDIEKLHCRAAIGAVRDDNDPPVLLEDEEAARTIRRLFHADRQIERQGREDSLERYVGEWLGIGKRRRACRK